MGAAKDLRVAPIASADARAFIAKYHYSGGFVRNSQLHLGVFLAGRLQGALQFGPPMDKRHVLGLVADTPWNGMIELNRLAFTDCLPRNSESRALGVALRLLRREYPHIGWVLSFADACQCGDGAIYRAAGFVLTQIKKNAELVRLPDGSRGQRSTLNTNLANLNRTRGKASPPAGSKALPGFMLRYVYFLDPAARARLTCPVIPFAEIERRGAAMFRGRPKQAMAGSPGTAAG